MDAYPFNLILAVATASATLFLGFLPTKSISPALFTRETGKGIIAWSLVAFTSPHQLLQYLMMMAFFCFASWWHFRRDRALNGKMWLSLASGLGISLGVIMILNATPRAFPPGLSHLDESLLLASIYLGGGVIGLAYVCFALIQSGELKSTSNVNALHRYLGLLLAFTVARAAAILATFSALPGHYESKTVYPNITESVPVPYTPFSIKSHLAYVTEGSFSVNDALLLGLAVFVLPALAFMAKNHADLSAHTQLTRILVALIIVGSLTEILARICIL